MESSRFTTSSRFASPLAVAHVCDDIACRIKGGEGLCAELEHRSGPESEGCWKRSPCLGRCESAPAALVSGGRVAGCDLARPHDHRGDRGRRASRSIESRGFESLVNRYPSSATRGSPARRESAGSTPRASRTTGPGRVRRSGERVELGPEGVIREVLASKLMGRGGAAFPTGRKWEAVAKAPARPHYVVCNADESEPGTFKDRVLLEGDPFAVIEGMTIAGFATGSMRGYLYVRGEYPLATHRIAMAISAARAAGLLGENVMNSGCRLRSRAPQWRGRLHLRRRDRPLQLNRGETWRAAEPAAISGSRRALRQADGYQ